MTKIVGHRGASGRELENTIKSFKLAKELGVDAIELDVLITADGQFVVCHDNDLKRLTGKSLLISDIPYAELAEIRLSNQETIPLLYDVLQLIGDIPIILDLKMDKNLPELFSLLAKFPDTPFTIVTALPHIIKDCKKIRPDIPAFVERSLIPFRLLNSVKKYGADGLNLRHIWLNPFTYRAAIKQGLQIQVWTVNNVFIAHALKKLYPGVWICTNHPDRFIEVLSEKKLQK